MSVQRRLMNLVMMNRSPGSRLLSCVDLRSQLFGDAISPESTIGYRSELFGNAISPESTIGDRSESTAQLFPTRILDPPASLKMESFELPRPILNYEAPPLRYQYGVYCFPLTDGRVILSNHSGPTFLLDAHERRLVYMPNLHKPKWEPISLFVPSSDADDNRSGGGSLYIMETTPTPEVGFSTTQLSDQFEVFLCGSKLTDVSFPWHWQLLPPPPFVRSQIRAKIISYAVVGSNICISTDCAGTYCLDTVSNSWNQVGRWMLPFCGKVEYVPELKLWFGFSTQARHFAAADLATMDSQPQLVGDLKEFEPPDLIDVDWVASDSQLVNLGSGCFCIARFFHIMPEDLYTHGNYSIVVLTGVEATPLVHDNSCAGIGNGKIKFTKHKSRCFFSKASIISDIF